MLPPNSEHTVNFDFGVIGLDAKLKQTQEYLVELRRLKHEAKVARKKYIWGYVCCTGTRKDGLRCLDKPAPGRMRCRRHPYRTDK